MNKDKSARYYRPATSYVFYEVAPYGDDIEELGRPQVVESCWLAELCDLVA